MHRDSIWIISGEDFGKKETVEVGNEASFFIKRSKQNVMDLLGGDNWHSSKELTYLVDRNSKDIVDAFNS